MARIVKPIKKQDTTSKRLPKSKTMKIPSDNRVYPTWNGPQKWRQSWNRDVTPKW